MSDGAYVDPAKLRQFAADLARTLDDYHRAIEMLDRKMARLEQTWRDQEFDRFKGEIATTRRIIEEFIQEGRKAKLELLRDADAAEAIQRVRN